ncbi:LysR family transcriptional regulator [Jannaschia pagri]|uniref:LysR family transcriptional regulator n=1 Tax=Jannaschia pagri TaxID=2829797 RepID=A0ABQ4NP97_9RHOB|nr:MULTISPECIES: LysR family transcriptional regulator [unclassified Jannaschia]GIT92385.1 LysR family transcriptional regulator [Jannaschia sp. AI_61]GIT96220.1 LysR family transcriptional regulator [Jannaschia sp. AI_62]
MSPLNYHHLRYFHAVATEGHLGRAAERLNLSQSALSIQIKQLEARLGHDLFERAGRRLVLTEAGRIALDHADRIFGAGEELLASLAGAGGGLPLRVGAQSTLSRNFQLRFLRPVLESDIEVVLRSGGTERLLADLQALSLDVVLTTELPEAEGLTATRIDEQVVGLHGVPDRVIQGDLAGLLSAQPLILPTDTAIRTQVEGVFARLGVAPRVVADVDDMAMIRLLARDGAGLAVAPSVVLADEIASGRIVTAPFDLGVRVPFYAVTLRRRFPHPALAQVMGA